MDKFRKKRYRDLSKFIDDIRFLFKNRQKIRCINQGNLISEDFRERLMMVVTAVNGCRYCSFYHSKLALKSGIKFGELESLLEGDLKDSPDKEKIALLYAQHWADNNGEIDEDFEEKLIKTYGNKKAEVIKLAIRSMKFGNMVGNTIDYFLYKITFGLLGN